MLVVVALAAVGYAGYSLYPLYQGHLTVDGQSIFSKHFDVEKMGESAIVEVMMLFENRHPYGLQVNMEEGEAKILVDTTDENLSPVITFMYHLNDGGLKVIHGFKTNQSFAELSTFGHIPERSSIEIDPLTPEGIDQLRKEFGPDVEIEITTGIDTLNRVKESNAIMREVVSRPDMTDFSGIDYMPFTEDELRSLMSYAVAAATLADMGSFGPKGTFVEPLKHYVIMATDYWPWVYGKMYANNHFYQVLWENILMRWDAGLCLVFLVFLLINFWRKNVLEVVHEQLTKHKLWTWGRFVKISVSNFRWIVWPEREEKMKRAIIVQCQKIKQRLKEIQIALEERELARAVQAVWEKVPESERENRNFSLMYQAATSMDKSRFLRRRALVELEKAIVRFERGEVRQELESQRRDTPIFFVEKTSGKPEREIVLEELIEVGVAAETVDAFRTWSMTRLRNLVLVSKVVENKFGVMGLERLFDLESLESCLDNNSELVSLVRIDDLDRLSALLGLDEDEEPDVPDLPVEKWREFVEGNRVVIVSGDRRGDFLKRLEVGLCELGATEVVVINPKKKKRVFEAISPQTVFVLVRCGLGHDIGDTLNARRVKFEVINIGNVERLLA